MRCGVLRWLTPDMAKRATTIWVPIEKIFPHPGNANVMTDEQRQKLRRNIEQTGYYPPIIVRSLELSNDFVEDFEAEKLQILDGEHRWLDCKDQGAKQIEVRVWTGISDDRAKTLLLTLNRLQGKDNPKKRGELIRELAQIEDDADSLAEIIPEDPETIRRYVDEQSKEAIANAQERARELGRQEPMTIFMEPEQAEVVRRALRTWLDVEDAKQVIVECREGAALHSICQRYLDGVDDHE